MGYRISTLLPLFIVGVVLLARPADAFGAGNIGGTSKIEGQNWRHGDIEDTLLTLLTARAMGGKKFSKLDVKRVYFGNWLRDYSQAVDVGTVKSVSAEAVRLLLWILAFVSFGYGTGEFEVTKDRLGCYRPEEHIDNPKDYADNIDARHYDRRLRGPVDERRELSIDERTGLKNYIANEDAGITTSAGMIRQLFRRSIELGRNYTRSGNEKEFYEALRLLGTGCHCLEDYTAHSNYTELALIELGERDVFPHVGRRTQMQIQGARHAVYPIVTGTFGGVDFLHSVCGELSDKATQSEIQDLEGTIQQSQRADTSLLKELLNKIPSGLLGDDDHAAKADELEANAAAAKMQALQVTPKEPEAFTRQAEQLAAQIYPILEFHDNIIKHISEAIEKIPVLPDLIEQLQDQINVFVFSLIAPIVLPIINQVKEELSTGSSEIIQSSNDKQHVVFLDDNSTDPTHSMLSKDHFSNILNEPAGKIASQTIAWVVPQIVAAWDDPHADVRRINDRIIHGVFHHPAQRDMGEDGAKDGRMKMFRTLEHWWSEKDEREKDQFRRQLSREGVEQGKNHKPGVHDGGHGCGKPLGLPTLGTSTSSGAIGGKLLSELGGALSGGSGGQYHGGSGSGGQFGKMAGEAVGGGVLGSVVGGLVGGAGQDLLGSGFGEGSEKNTYQSGSHNRDGSYTSNVMQTGHRPPSRGHEEKFGQAEVRTTQYPSGGHKEEYSRYEQDGRGGQSGYGFTQRTEVHPSYGGGYEQRSERRQEYPGGRYESEVQEQRFDSSGRQFAHQEQRHGHKSDDSDDDDDSGDDYEKRQKKERKKEEKRMKKMREEQQQRQQQQQRQRSRSREKSRSRERKRSGSRERRRQSGSPQRRRSGSRERRGSGGGGGLGGFLSGMLSGHEGGQGGPGHRGGRGGMGMGGGPHRGGGHPGGGMGMGGGHHEGRGGGNRGRGHRGSQQDEYTQQQQTYDSSNYGRQESSYGQATRDEYGSTAYSGQPSYGSSGYGPAEETSYGQSGYGEQPRRGEYGSSGYSQQQSYDSNNYGRSDETSYGQSGYGSESRRDEYESSGGYGAQQQQYGGPSYGGSDDAYRGRSEYRGNDGEEGSYGEGQSYGGNNGYDQGGYGQGGGYGQSGYGERY